MGDVRLMNCNRTENGKAKDKNKPNIVIILCDDLGYGDISCYGSKLNETPILDQMASEGLLFTDFYMTSPVCSPSRAGLMTGCYPQRVGLGKGDDYVVLMPGDSLDFYDPSKELLEG